MRRLLSRPRAGAGGPSPRRGRQALLRALGRGTHPRRRRGARGPSQRPRVRARGRRARRPEPWAGAAGVAGRHGTQAVMTDRDAVLEANAAFYAAFESLDLKRMEEVWLRAAYIKCVHPGWGLLVGWGPVMESWERIFSGTLEMRCTLTGVQAEVCGDLAWVVLTENIGSRHATTRSRR